MNTRTHRFLFRRSLILVLLAIAVLVATQAAALGPRDPAVQTLIEYRLEERGLDAVRSFHILKNELSLRSGPLSPRLPGGRGLG